MNYSGGTSSVPGGGKSSGGLERKSTSGSTKRTSPQDPALPDQFSVSGAESLGVGGLGFIQNCQSRGPLSRTGSGGLWNLYGEFWKELSLWARNQC